jgi:CheY-like chemotaxis protein
VKTVPDLVNPKLLEVFRREAEEAVIVLRKTAANGEIERFTTAVHAMKSALANIAEDEKSEQAFALENAGLQGNADYIAANAGSFVETLEKLIQSITPPETADNTSVKADEDVAYLAEQLRLIELACEDYDVTAVYSVLDGLKEKRWSKETVAALEDIRNAIFFNSDFEGAAEQVIELSQRERQSMLSDRKKTVLIVDDSAFMRNLIKDMLHENGLRVVGEAENGKIGAEKYKALKPDIVTLDFYMDEATGSAAIELIMNTIRTPTSS